MLSITQIDCTGSKAGRLAGKSTSSCVGLWHLNMYLVAQASACLPVSTRDTAEEERRRACHLVASYSSIPLDETVQNINEDTELP